MVESKELDKANFPLFKILKLSIVSSCALNLSVTDIFFISKHIKFKSYPPEVKICYSF